MKATRRRTAVTASIAAAVLVLSACGGGEGDDVTTDPEGEEVQRSGTLIYGQGTAFPENLLPYIAAGNSVATSDLVSRVLMSPFRVNPDYTLAHDEDLMASEPTLEETDTGQIVTYEIAEDAVWSDETPITAADFEFTWRVSRSSDPAEGGCPALLSTVGYEQIESVEGDDGKTVTVTFDSPYQDWQGLFDDFLPAHLMDQDDDAANCEVITEGWPIGEGIPEDISAGPWQITSDGIDAGAQVVVLTPNPNWYGEGPLLESLIHQTIGDEPSTVVSALQSGEVSYVQPQPQLDLVSQVQALEPNVVNEAVFGLSFEHFDLNLANPHLAKLEVRQAFGLALDRAALVDATVGEFDDRAQVMNNRVFVNNQPEYVDNAPEQYNTQDIDGAIALLESVGYTIGADGVATHPEDGPLSLIMSTTQNNPLREDTIDVATAQVAPAGFAIEKFLDPDIFGGAELPTSLEARGFEIALFAWVSSPFKSSNVGLYMTGGGQNYAGVSSEEVDATLEEFSVELDPATATDLLNEADALLWEEMGTIPLYQKPQYYAWSSEFEGIEPNATTAGPLWNSDAITTVE